MAAVDITFAAEGGRKLTLSLARVDEDLIEAVVSISNPPLSGQLDVVVLSSDLYSFFDSLKSAHEALDGTVSLDNEIWKDFYLSVTFGGRGQVSVQVEVRYFAPGKEPAEPDGLLAGRLLTDQTFVQSALDDFSKFCLAYRAWIG